ncbi:MAG: Rpn family recombination-promoting nuclease/putative transposase, partial [Mariprofundaceae bacterium]|nr:Rpn family recombination-promoting nuclease/putative transposase [Mariprofundaceae bacterium]
MQVEGASGFHKRIIYYSSKAYVTELPKGDLYHKLKPVIFLGILNFTLFDNEHYISRHLILNKETGTHELKDLEFNFVELPKFNKEEHQCHNLAEKWIYFLKNADNLELIPNSTTPALQHAYECASEHIWTKEELALYDYRWMQMGQEWGRLDFAMKKGIEKGILKVAISLLDVLDDATIAEKTELPINIIQQLRRKDRGKN